MKNEYNHTQFGKSFIIQLIILAIVVIPVLSLLFSWKIKIGTILSTGIVFIIFILLFYSLTIQVVDNQIKIRFGIGLIKKTFPINEISSTEVVKNKWYNGFGIRGISGGILYSVSGLDAVEIIFNSGKIIRLGTDKPGNLKRMIDQMISVKS